MGIKRLHWFLKEATDGIHIKEYAGKRVAVDTYCWIHKGTFGCAQNLVMGNHTDMYVKYVAKFVNMLESFNVIPILVFDGCNLPAKKHVEKERREKRELYLAKGKKLLREGDISGARDCFTKCVNVSPAMALEVMKWARSRGIDCIVAPYEADAQLAYLLKQNLAEAVITEDSDLLTFGCNTVLFKLDLTGQCQRIDVSSFGRVSALQGFTNDQFRHLCILAGCDYLPNVRGVGIVKAAKALKLSQSRNIHLVAKTLHRYVKGLSPVDASYADNFDQAEKTFLYQLVFDPVSRKVVPLNAYPEGVNMEDLPFAGEPISDDIAFQISIGNIEVNRKRKVASFDVDRWLRNLKTSVNYRSIWRHGSVPLCPAPALLPDKSECGFLFQDTLTNKRKNHLVPTPSKATCSRSSHKQMTASEALQQLEDLDETERETKACSSSTKQKNNDTIVKYMQKQQPKKTVSVKSRFFSKPTSSTPVKENLIGDDSNTTFDDLVLNQAEADVAAAGEPHMEKIADARVLKETLKRKAVTDASPQEVLQQKKRKLDGTCPSNGEEQDDADCALPNDDLIDLTIEVESKKNAASKSRNPFRKSKTKRDTKNRKVQNLFRTPKEGEATGNADKRANKSGFKKWLNSGLELPAGSNENDQSVVDDDTNCTPNGDVVDLTIEDENESDQDSNTQNPFHKSKTAITHEKVQNPFRQPEKSETNKEKNTSSPLLSGLELETPNGEKEEFDENDKPKSKNPFRKSNPATEANKDKILNLFTEAFPDSVVKLNDSHSSRKGTTTVKSKYFGRARASGLKKSKKQMKPQTFQASIKSFFDKV